ncbi:hypothetical protein [Thalassoroseus pseudoceratinae]|uniref:hypothetical protein n=1 Tax=Thalassoroseus pseudoceratinae TaxID=2713176 RepID=UPI00141FD4FE|nr:hypothetical protein [Thalassoroseus pseudoceratinae]
MVRRVGAGLLLGAVAVFAACGILDEEFPLVLGVIAAGGAGTFLLWRSGQFGGYGDEVEHFEINWQAIGERLLRAGQSLGAFGKRSVRRLYLFVSRLCFSAIIGLGTGLVMLGTAAMNDPNSWQYETLQRIGPPIGQSALMAGCVLLITMATWYLLGLRKLRD